MEYQTRCCRCGRFLWLPFRSTRDKECETCSSVVKARKTNARRGKHCEEANPSQENAIRVMEG